MAHLRAKIRSEEFDGAALEVFGESLASGGGGHEQPVVGTEDGRRFSRHLLGESDGGRVLDGAVEGEADLMVIGSGEVGDGFALLDLFLVDQVHPLPRSFDQAASGEDLGDVAVPGILAIEDILDGDPEREAARAGSEVIP